MEYASQAAFLEKLRTEGEILWTFFTRDKKGNWRIKPHAREGFYRFMASWSIYLRNPAHYGWADNLSKIPAPEFHEHKIAPTDEQMTAAMSLFHDAGAGLLGDSSLGVVQRGKLSQIAKGFRYDTAEGSKKKHGTPIRSLKPDVVADLICSEAAAGLQVLVWTVFDEETRIVAERLQGRGVNFAVLDGSLKESARLEILERFRRGELEALISKASLLGFGMNFQHVGAMIFSGWDDSYERFYQAIKRAFRYGQTKSVQVHIPFIPELEGPILENILRKKVNFEADAEEQERYYKIALEGMAA
jgi:superfamily II DNA or RNA helicase